MEILGAIKKTIKYSQKYDGELNRQQLFERLIDEKVYDQIKFEEALKKNLEIEKKIIGDERNKLKEEKVSKAKKMAKIIEKKFEDIIFLGITGSVAAGYPKNDDDIDLLIITKANKLWINRLKLRWFIHTNKIPHRRFGQKEKKDEFCFNLWLDEKSLKIRKERQNLRNAIDLILMEPLINKENTYEKFIGVNDWVKKYVATGYSLKPSVQINRNTSLNREVLLDKVVNWLVFWPQFGYMRKRIKKEKIGLHEAFFHH